MMDLDKLVKKETLVKFGEKCKKIFLPFLRKEEANQFILHLDETYTDNDSFALTFDVIGYKEDGICSALAYFDYDGVTGIPTGYLVNKTGERLDKITVDLEDHQFKFYLQFANTMKHLSMTCRNKDGKNIVNAIKPVSSIPTVPVFDIVEHITPQPEEVIFSVKDASSIERPYFQEVVFDSIETAQKAQKLTRPVNITVTGDVMGSVSTDFSEDVKMELKYTEKPEYDIPYASYNTFGIVKLGFETNYKNGCIRVQQTGGNLYIALPTAPYDPEEEMNYYPVTIRDGVLVAKVPKLKEDNNSSNTTENNNDSWIPNGSDEERDHDGDNRPDYNTGDDLPNVNDKSDPSGSNTEITVKP